VGRQGEDLHSRLRFSEWGDSRSQGPLDRARQKEASTNTSATPGCRHPLRIPIRQPDNEGEQDKVHGLGGEERIQVGYENNPQGVGEGAKEMKENPKHVQAQKEGKTPYEFIPLASLSGAARVLAHGAKKYGRKNWRIDHINASTYQGAIMRHLIAYYDGETFDRDSGENHLSHIMANCMVLLDATEQGSLIDDRLEKESINDKRASSKGDSDSVGINRQLGFEFTRCGDPADQPRSGGLAAVGSFLSNGYPNLGGTY